MTMMQRFTGRFGSPRVRWVIRGMVVLGYLGIFLGDFGDGLYIGDGSS